MNIKELVKNKFKEELLSQLGFRNKNELFRELVVYLNENIIVSYDNEDNEETKLNKHLISQFVNKYKVVNEDFIKEYIENNLYYWDLYSLKDFIDSLNLNSDYHLYNSNMEEFTSLDDLDVEDEDLEKLIDLILELK